jgi:hypothetical protein
MYVENIDDEKDDCDEDEAEDDVVSRLGVTQNTFAVLLLKILKTIFFVMIVKPPSKILKKKKTCHDFAENFEEKKNLS